MDSCSWWFEGSWAHCCFIHDIESKGWLDITSHLHLADCVSSTSGGPIMGTIMFVGIFAGGWFYQLTRKKPDGR